jgi:hypothetical protein
MQFVLNGPGGFPGIPAYASTTDLTNARTSGQGWLVKNAATSARVYDYRAIVSQIPSDTIINSLPATVTNSDFNAANSSYGYTWYKYSGNGGLPLTINGPLSVGSKRIVLLVGSADLNINGPINLTDGSGFFMVLVGKTAGGGKGNILVNSTVGGAAPDLEGIYEADNTFTDNAGNTQLWVRGSLTAYGGVSLLRDLAGANSTTPAEVFEYAPDQILLYPPKLGIRRLTWKEVAP